MGFDISRDDERNTSVDPALWGRFAKAATVDEYFFCWLALQCSLISHVVQGVLVMGDPGGDAFAPVSKWPEDGQDSTRLAEILEQTLADRCGLVVELVRPVEATLTSRRHYAVAYPVVIDDRLHGAAALEVMAQSQEELQAVMGQLQWGVAWLELLFRRRRMAEDGAALEHLRSAVDLLAGALAEEQFEGASLAFVTELATQLQCDRVSLGFVRRSRAHVRAISHSAQFGKRMNLNRAIGLAMDEAIVQRREILYPLPGEAEALVIRDHEELAKQQGAGSILTLPLYGSGRYFGALTLERPGSRPFEEDEVALCRSVAALAASALEIKRQNDRHFLLKGADALQRQTARLFGPRYVGRKLAAIVCMGLIVFFSLAQGTYRLSADVVLEGAVRRVVTPPFNGYIKASDVRAGDLVKKDQLMCILDDRDLHLERMNWLSKRSQFQRKYQEAFAEHDRAEVNIINAQLDQAVAELNLVESQLARTQIKAPFDGIVVSGDLSQRLGGLVEQGEVLFEVAPLDAYRVILQVDERRIADVQEGQLGSLVLSAMPDDHFDFVVEKITPISSAEEGRNYFRVEARLDEVSPRLRPGMEGVGKITVDRRKLISIWTRNLTEWLRLWIWSWWP